MSVSRVWRTISAKRLTALKVEFLTRLAPQPKRNSQFQLSDSEPIIIWNLEFWNLESRDGVPKRSPRRCTDLAERLEEAVDLLIGPDADPQAFGITRIGHQPDEDPPVLELLEG